MIQRTFRHYQLINRARVKLLSSFLYDLLPFLLFSLYIYLKSHQDFNHLSSYDRNKLKKLLSQNNRKRFGQTVLKSVFDILSKALCSNTFHVYLKQCISIELLIHIQKVFANTDTNDNNNYDDCVNSLYDNYYNSIEYKHSITLITSQEYMLLYEIILNCRHRNIQIMQSLQTPFIFPLKVVTIENVKEFIITGKDPLESYLNKASSDHDKWYLEMQQKRLGRKHPLFQELNQQLKTMSSSKDINIFNTHTNDSVDVNTTRASVTTSCIDNVMKRKNERRNRITRKIMNSMKNKYYAKFLTSAARSNNINIIAKNYDDNNYSKAPKIDYNNGKKCLLLLNCITAEDVVEYYMNLSYHISKRMKFTTNYNISNDNNNNNEKGDATTSTTTSTYDDDVNIRSSSRRGNVQISDDSPLDLSIDNNNDKNIESSHNRVKSKTVMDRRRSQTNNNNNNNSKRYSMVKVSHQPLQEISSKTKKSIRITRITTIKQS